MKKFLLAVGIFVFVANLLFLVGCSKQDAAIKAAIKKADNREDYYIPKNDLDFKNYNKRQMISDDPTVILWCTSAFPIPSSPLFTVPIVGKLTSGSKRPFPNDPGPDGMYGPSGEYRYGLTPSNVYADWYNMSTFCTTEPMVWQRKQTVIVMQQDPVLLEAHKEAREFLRKGQVNKANEVLEKAINSIREGEGNE